MKFALVMAYVGALIGVGAYIAQLCQRLLPAVAH